tara:strand:- start:72368 stop:73282 length:915 start_codon:yes stop_codon:yes gene_type:complete
MQEENKPRGFVDYTGFKSGKVTVLSFHSWHVQPSGQRKSKWLCSCECGNEFVAMGSNLRKEGHTTSCGCEVRKVLARHRERVASGEWIPEKLNGKRYGRLTVVGFERWERIAEDQQVSVWKCTCECGNEHITRRNNLGEHSSCGCWFREKISASSTKHGMYGTPTHKSWTKMKERCYLSTYEEKDYYQDRGITVCDRWLESFENFLEDMGERPEGTSLDRINPNLGYYKENCRWADLTTQSYNRRMNTNNTSGRTGVFQLRNGNWQAIIGYYKERIVLAYDVSFEEAVKAREDAELKYYGWNKE